MTLQLGDTVPDFTQDSQLGPINLYDFAGDSWVVLFSHPADYTPVCTTELGEVSRLRPEWQKRNVKTIALSVDSAESHNGWICDINETQKTSVDYPILADADKEPLLLRRLFDVGLNQQGIHFRMNVLHGNLKAVKSPRLTQLHFRHETHRQVFHDNAVRCGKKRNHHLDEMLLFMCQAGPMLQIFGQVHLLYAPKTIDLLFVHVPYAQVLQRKHDKT